MIADLGNVDLGKLLIVIAAFSDVLAAMLNCE